MAKRARRKDGVLKTLKMWSDSRNIELLTFSEVHTRLTDDYTVVDVWPTTGRYWVGKTSYFEQSEKRVVERTGEKGFLPVGTNEIAEWLDKLFYAAYQ